jgi:anti-sigma factor NepR-like protein
MTPDFKIDAEIAMANGKKDDRKNQVELPHVRSDEVIEEQMTNEGETPSLPPEVSAAIGRELQRVYEQQLKEPIPDRFTKLLDDLANGKRKG